MTTPVRTADPTGNLPLSLQLNPSSTLSINRLIAANNLNSAIRLAEIYAHSGSYEASFEHLQSVHDAIEAGIDQHEADEYLIHIFYSPFLRPLHADRRWAEWMDDARS